MSSPDQSALEPTIRLYRDADVEAMHVLRFVSVNEIASDVYTPDIMEGWGDKLETARIEAFRANKEQEVRLVMELGAKLVGYAAFRTPEPDQADIHGIYVMPGLERQGLGTKLLLALEDEARRRGLKQCWVTSPVNAIALFENNGYEFVTDGVHQLFNGSQVRCARLMKAF